MAGGRVWSLVLLQSALLYQFLISVQDVQTFIHFVKGRDYCVNFMHDCLENCAVSTLETVKP